MRTQAQPLTIAQLAETVVASAKAPKEAFGYALRNFLDAYYKSTTPQKRKALAGEPCMLRSRLRDGGVADAYLAALANHLARTDGFPSPRWAVSKKRMPDRPWFALNTPQAKMWLLTQSPAAFRERNLFISADGLSRA